MGCWGMGKGELDPGDSLKLVPCLPRGQTPGPINSVQIDQPRMCDFCYPHPKFCSVCAWRTTCMGWGGWGGSFVQNNSGAQSVPECPGITWLCRHKGTREGTTCMATDTSIPGWDPLNQLKIHLSQVVWAQCQIKTNAGPTTLAWKGHSV